MDIVSLFAAASLTVFMPSQRSGETCELSRINRAFATTSSCLSCHDGSAHSVGGEMLAGRGSHPVDVSYDLATANPRARLRPASLLDPALVLPLGRVACVTCHDGSVAQPGRPSLPPHRLCTECHDL